MDTVTYGPLLSYVFMVPIQFNALKLIIMMIPKQDCGGRCTDADRTNEYQGNKVIPIT